MPILIVLTLVPTLSFYFYVLVQFWAEANRRRHHDTCTMIVPLESVSAAETDYNPHHESDHDAVTNNAVGTATQPLRPVAVLSPYLKNRLLEISSQSGRPAARRTAKG